MGGPGSGPQKGGGIRHSDNKAFGSSPSFEAKLKEEKKFEGSVLREQERLLDKYGGNEFVAREKAETNVRKREGSGASRGSGKGSSSGGGSGFMSPSTALGRLTGK